MQRDRSPRARRRREPGRGRTRRGDGSLDRGVLVPRWRGRPPRGFQAWLEIATGVGVLGWTWATRDRATIRTFARRHAWPGLLAGTAAVGGYLAYLVAVAVLPIAPVAALRESSVLFSALIGAILFRERLGARRVLGALLIASGIVALGTLG